MAGEFDMLAFDRATDALGTAADRLLHVQARRRAALLRFMLPDDATAIPVAQDGPMDLIQDAIDACPVTCIHWVTDEDARAQELTTGR